MKNYIKQKIRNKIRWFFFSSSAVRVYDILSIVLVSIVFNKITQEGLKNLLSNFFFSGKGSDFFISVMYFYLILVVILLFYLKIRLENFVNISEKISQNSKIKKLFFGLNSQIKDVNKFKEAFYFESIYNRLTTYKNCTDVYRAFYMILGFISIATILFFFFI